MSPASSRSDGAPPTRRHLAWLLAVGFVVLFFRLGATPLLDIDEGMHAAMARSMLESGDWITPRFSGEPFFDKPALFTWLGALSFAAFGLTELAARLPSAVLAMTCALLVYFLGRRLIPTRAAFYAALVLLTSAGYIVLGRVVVHDMTLTCGATLAILASLLGVREEQHRRSWFVLAWLAMAFSVLAKGPIGVLLPGLVGGSFLLLRRRLALVGPFCYPVGPLLFVLLCVPWYVLVARDNPEYLGSFFLEKNLGSFFSEESTHPQPFYYYTGVLPTLFLPWSGLGLVALAWAAQRLRRGGQEVLLYFFLWVVVIFLFFSAAQSKLPPYLLPILPGLALLVGSLLHQLQEDLQAGNTSGLDGSERLLRWAVAGVLMPAVILPGGAYYLMNVPPGRLMSRLSIDEGMILTLLGIGAIGGVLAAVQLRRQHVAHFVALAVATTVATAVYATVALLPRLSEHRSSKHLVESLEHLLPPGAPVISYDRAKDSTAFYTGRANLRVRPEEALMEHLAVPEPAYALIERRDWFRSRKVQHWAVVVEVRGSTMLIANRLVPKGVTANGVKDNGAPP